MVFLLLLRTPILSSFPVKFAPTPNHFREIANGLWFAMRIEKACEKIMSQLQTTEACYHRLVLIVAPAGNGKTALLQLLQEKVAGAAYVNVNLELSQRLLDLTTQQRPLKTQPLLQQLIADKAPQIALLDNTEILFEPSLKTDPLRLLKMMSRNRTIVAAWNGKAENDHLVYAEPDHPEYKVFPIEGIFAVTL